MLLTWHKHRVLLSEVWIFFKLVTSQPLKLVSEMLFYIFESAKGPSFNLLTKTIGNMAIPEFDFATDLKYGNSFKIS